MSKAHYIMVGGFLGAGKTTAILRFAQHLHQRGLKIGLITNDQSYGLVDTTMFHSHGFDVEEITGGCFCCKFNSLVEASQRLSHATRPDVFIAEPVGSCTDLRATVSYPLRRIYGEDYHIAPLSVLVDPLRALRVLGLEPGKVFSNKVLYVYGKQLEEAEFIAINKCDLLTSDRLEKLQQGLRDRFPRAEQFSVSAREGTGLEPWFDRVVSSEPGSSPPPDVDYDLYAEGEAQLGWLNSAVHLISNTPFDGNAILLELARRIHQGLASEALEIAHLKMTLTPDEDLGDIAVLNLVRTGGSPEMSHILRESLESGELIINLRAEGDPETLRIVTMQSVQSATEQINDLRFTIEHEESFRPARPVPTYRMARL